LIERTKEARSQPTAPQHNTNYECQENPPNQPMEYLQ